MKSSHFLNHFQRMTENQLRVYLKILMRNNAFLQNEMLNLLKHIEQIQQICHDFYLYRLKLALLDIRKKKNPPMFFTRKRMCTMQPYGRL